MWQEQAGRVMALPWTSLLVAVPSCPPARARMGETPNGSWGWMKFCKVQQQCVCSLLVSWFSGFEEPHPQLQHFRGEDRYQIHGVRKHDAQTETKSICVVPLHVKGVFLQLKLFHYFLYCFMFFENKAKELFLRFQITLVLKI